MINLPRRALIIDTETDGTDPKVNHIIEVACILFDLKFGSAIASFSAALKGDSNAAEHINGIPVMLLLECFTQERVWAGVCDLMANADVILAHKAAFDRSFIEASTGFKSISNGLYKQPWVCTQGHVAWPNASQKISSQLTSLALSYGVGVVSAHRALTDCDIISRILTRLHEAKVDLQKLIGDAAQPRVKMQALVSFADKDLAKAQGFAWEPETKRWIRECLATDKFAFKTRVIP